MKNSMQTKIPSTPNKMYGIYNCLLYPQFIPISLHTSNFLGQIVPYSCFTSKSQNTNNIWSYTVLEKFAFF